MASVMRRRGREGGRSRFYVVRFRDHTGRVRQETTRTTDRKSAERRAREIEERELALAAGRVTTAELAAEAASRRPFLEHVAEYLDDCRRLGQASRAVDQKGSVLRAFAESEGLRSLRDLQAERLRRFLRRSIDAGDSRRQRCKPTPAKATRAETPRPLSARTWNFKRAIVLAFANWCRRERRLAKHDLGDAAVSKLREETDRRRVRRDILPEEMRALVEVVSGTPRAPLYLFAALTGLRRSELAGLRWRDYRRDEGTIVVPASLSKSRVEAELPLHPEAIEAIESLRGGEETPQGRVFQSMPPAKLFYRDLAAAGIQAIDATGRPVEDAGGTVVDFHSLRGTAATVLVRAGVKPLHLKRLMRHADIKTTDRHYLGLRTSDMRQAVELFGGFLESPAALRATGTDSVCGGDAGSPLGVTKASPLPAPFDASRCISLQRGAASTPGSVGLQSPAQCGLGGAAGISMRSDAASGRRDSNPRHSAWEADEGPC